MMIILSQKEYNKLIQEATNLEQRVDDELKKEKQRIWDLLGQAFKNRYPSPEYFEEGSAVNYIKKKLDEILK